MFQWMTSEHVASKEKQRGVLYVLVYVELVWNEEIEL